jgi:hypothetical protein
VEVGEERESHLRLTAQPLRDFAHPVEDKAMQLLIPLVIVAGLYGLGTASASATPGDIDDNGYLDARDLVGFNPCLQGPESSPGPACILVADMNGDGAVDLIDVARFQTSLGHLPIPLRDTVGDVLTINSTRPYSGRQTCTGTCHVHDVDLISNGFMFQQGRTNPDGDVVLGDDFFGNAHRFNQSAGMFGRFRPAAPDGSWMSSKHNDSPSQMDKTAFFWNGFCAVCHVGGGPGEVDQDGYKYWDEATGLFGYEAAGLNDEDVQLDRDYAFLNPANGTVTPARWDITGVSDPDCLFCHRTQRTIAENGTNMNWVWRAATLRASTNLTDETGNSVPAFASAATAGQGWFSLLELVTPPPPLPLAKRLQIDYGVGVTDGSLMVQDNEQLALTPESVAFPPRDEACWWCHDRRKRGEVWFTPDNVMYAKFNKLLDDDPSNDIPPSKSKACTYCHPNLPDHGHYVAKGNSFAMRLNDHLDSVGFRSCRECHLELLPSGEMNPNRHPDAPPFPGEALVHLAGPMTEVLACQACHIPFGETPAGVQFDNAVTGNQISFTTASFLSADPLDPTDPDKSRWYPGFQWKEDTDGVMRLFPLSYMLSTWWADWDQRETPDDYSDDVIIPIALWRVREITGGAPLPIVTDDNVDGIPEVNRPEEIHVYLEALLGTDSYGTPFAARPVLVKGRQLWFLDPESPTGVNTINHGEVGITVEWATGYSLSHYVRRAEEAWGAGDHSNPGCAACHTPVGTSPVFDRLILVDPYGPDGQPVYETVRAMTGLNPP